MPTPSSSIIALPEQIAIDVKTPIGNVRQLRRACGSLDSALTNFTFNNTSGRLFTRTSGERILIVEKKIFAPDSIDEVLLHLDGAPGRWLKPIPISGDTSLQTLFNLPAAVLESWTDQFVFLEEKEIGGSRVPGLRTPQIGALYMVLGHWKTSDEPANVVMPTGTGKTETMLAVLVKERLPKLFVVVPTDALRDQLARKFQTLGVLKQFGVVRDGARFPIVGTLKKIPTSVADVAPFFNACNVVVTTMAIAGRAPELIQKAFAASCTHLFIDEAHHIKAPTWEALKRQFADKRILQFTATPFRNDGKLVEGKPIFTYPLRQAQTEGYFTPIRFRPVVEPFLSDADREIATKAVAQLDTDLAAGFDHLLMARAEGIPRATEVHRIYQEIAPDHKPLLLHSKLTRTEKRNAMEALSRRESRVVVCVDMLGEGFDLPQLKVAAIHDLHKSLAVTLQFIGRFARALSAVGEATVVANIVSPDVEGSLRTLYAEDSDWNQLLRILTDESTAREVKRAGFLSEFSGAKVVVPIQNITPKMSTMIYRVDCSDWNLAALERMAVGMGMMGSLMINQKRRVALFIVRATEAIDWGAVRELANTAWHLYIVHWDSARQLLFIHTSDKEASLNSLAEATAGTSARLIAGEQVFRVFHNVKRLMLMNLGLSHSLSRAVRFTMFVGADIVEALSQAQQAGRTKSNTFGRGYENGEKATVGCSYRGRIWSYQIAPDVSAWVEWCHSIADKILDSTISFDKNILPYVTIFRDIKSRPSRVPLMIEWWEGLLRRSEDYVTVTFGDQQIPFFNVGMEVINRAVSGNLSFRIFTESEGHDYEVIFDGDKVVYRPLGTDLLINFGARKSLRLSEYFQDEPPAFYFDDGSFLIYNRYAPPNLGTILPFDPNRIESWDWNGVDIRIESQRRQKRPNSIQYRVIQAILSDSWEFQYDFVLDDDGANEAADIVAIKIEEEEILIHLFHCKYSSALRPGARVDDLYGVCGQAQRSARWRHDVEQMLHRTLSRAAERLRFGRTSFEKGTKEGLAGLRNRCRFLKPKLTVFVVQPGLSKAQVSESQCALLATTETYLKVTSLAALRVIASA